MSLDWIVILLIAALIVLPGAAYRLGFRAGFRAGAESALDRLSARRKP